MVADNLQEKAKRKNKTNLLIHTFFNLTLRSQTLANIHEIFQNISYRSTLHYTLHLHFTHFTSSFCTPYTCLVSQVAPIAEILWSISNFYMARDDLPSFGYFKKIALSTSFRKARKGRNQELLNNNKHHPRKRRLPPFFHSDTNLVLGQFLVHSAGKTYVLGVTVELTWLLFLNILSFIFFQRRTNLLGLQDSEEVK